MVVEFPLRERNELDRLAHGVHSLLTDDRHRGYFVVCVWAEPSDRQGNLYTSRSYDDRACFDVSFDDGLDVSLDDGLDDGFDACLDDVSLDRPVFQRSIYDKSAYVHVPDKCGRRRDVFWGVRKQPAPPKFV